MKFLNYPFNPELFSYNWKNEPDLELTALLDSGVMVNNGEIQNLISNGSDIYTIPFYNVLGGEPQNYDGMTDIEITEPEGDSQTGVVYGRAHGWRERDFVVDFNSGADPMKQITSQVAYFWKKQRNKRLMGILDGIFAVNNAEWKLHTLDISASADPKDVNKLGPTSLGELAQAANGDNMGVYKVAVMHSRVATQLAKLELLEFRKYTDANGVHRTLNIGDMNGYTVIVDDGVPVTGTGPTAKYTTYLLGQGALHYATAPVKTPVELTRDAKTAGGHTELITRMRETIHPNGFSFVKPKSGYTSSPTDAQLAATANWQLIAKPKAIALSKIVSNA